MKQIFVFTAGDADARSHLDDSIINPISDELVAKHAPKDLEHKIADIKTKGGGVYAWGATPGPFNQRNWELMEPGDVVLCVYGAAYHFVAECVDKTNSKDLARAIWGTRADNGETWQYMYFLTKPKAVEVPLDAVATYLNSRYMGFARISDEKLEKIIGKFGSIEAFIEQKFLSTIPFELDAERDFLGIMRRYQQENTVFRSAHQGARYCVASVDANGCDIQRLDASENERCTITQLEKKIEMVRSGGGSCPFNEDFNGTVAIRTGFLQARFFALSANRENILDVSNERKALDVFCETLKKLNVDRSSGKPKLYKPAMIACVVDGIASGELTENKITFDWIAPKFISKMASLGEQVTDSEAAMPFVHLNGDLFWMLCHKNLATFDIDGREGSGAVREKISHVTIKDTFWSLLQSPENQAQVLDALAKTWWPSTDKPQCWWVCQGSTYEHESKGGYIWAPQRGKNGQQLFYWTNVSNVKKGDIVINYAQGIRAISLATEDGQSSQKPAELEGNSWTKEGWLARLKYSSFEQPIPLGSVGAEIAKLDHDQSPFNVNGGVNQGYLFQVQPEALRILLKLFNLDDLPEPVQKAIKSLLGNATGETVTTTQPILSQIFDRVAGKGMVFSKEDIANFYCCLRTKPFVILAGISGTGKSKLARYFAEAVGATTGNHRFTLIPVRPDWNDNSDLIGYFDLQGQFQPGALVPTLIRALASPQEPFFLCLDEMNLARVEHYFSDFLSVIESRRWPANAAADRILTDPILTTKQVASLTNSTQLDEDVKAALLPLATSYPGGLPFPDNLFVIGTVNMDETTHPFSRKVLDRANAIEFSDIRLQEGLTAVGAAASLPPVALANVELKARFISMTDFAPVDPTLAQYTAKRMTELNNILKRAGFEIGYRIRDEAAFYLYYANEAGLDKEKAFQRVILQKILPRIQGSSNLVRDVLANLLNQFMAGGSKVDPTEKDGFLDKLMTLAASGSAIQRKISHMLIRYEQDGFTSYWAS